MIENFEQHINKLNIVDKIWKIIKTETDKIITREPILSSYYEYWIINHTTFSDALINLISEKISCKMIDKFKWINIFNSINFDKINKLIYLSCTDLEAVKERDPAFTSYSNVFLRFKGWLSIQIQRFANCLYLQDNINTALIIQSICSEKFGVDIHPAVSIGYGFMIDHATGVVIGETSSIGNNCTIYHNVTLGGTGKISSDRHPKIESNIIIGCGSILLGNIKIGSGTKIGAGSIVVESSEPNSVIIGNKSKIIKYY